MNLLLTYYVAKNIGKVKGGSLKGILFGVAIIAASFALAVFTGERGFSKVKETAKIVGTGTHKVKSITYYDLNVVWKKDSIKDCLSSSTTTNSSYTVGKESLLNRNYHKWWVWVAFPIAFFMFVMGCGVMVCYED